MGKLKSQIFLYIEKLLARYTDKIICISEAERVSALKYKITNNKKLQVILNGINFTAIENAIPIQRKDLGIPEDAFVVGMVGRISEQKAPDIFIKAAKNIQKKIPNSYFIIVGDGEQREEIERYAQENNINLFISGWTNNPYSYLKVFNIAMLLSRWEGFGLAIVEYMAAKKNFVATKIDAIPTIVRDGIDGILVEADSPEQAANAVISLYKNKELAERMKAEAWEYAHKRYDIQRVTEQHLQLFESICPKNLTAPNIISNNKETH